MDNSHYVIMFIIMILSGGLSTMNVWIDKWNDVRFSLNDLYMTLLMTGWMFLFMGFVYKNGVIGWIGAFLVVTNIICIRTQFLVDVKQYRQGMIPHHSMAVHMSRKLLEKGSVRPDIIPFVQNIIRTQEDEIEFLKGRF